MAIKTTSRIIPSFIRAASNDSRPVELTFNDVIDTNILSTSSFIYDSTDIPLKSTQQLYVDWSEFVNHTFFMSAEAKVNIAFDRIINGFPFDGTRLETEKFFEKLSGFERWVFDQFPKFRGQLHFSGTQTSETLPTLGTYIVVKDSAGALYPELSKTKTGASVLNPTSSMSIEMQLFIPAQTNAGTQVICQKTDGTSGYLLYLSPSSSTSSVNCTFGIADNTNAMTVTGQLNKGRFNHICAILNKDVTVPRLELYNDETLLNTSRARSDMGDLAINASDLTIGSGTAQTFDSVVVTPTQTLSGVIDEFRIFHEVRSSSQQKAYASKQIFTTNALKLYFRFNEPRPPLASNDSQIDSIVIDSSGNALHAVVNNFTGTLRLDASTDSDSKMLYERDETAPVLFPAYADIVTLLTDLLASGSDYDNVNPNLITRLVPQHYLLEGAVFEGFAEPEGYSNQPYSGNGLPGSGKLGSSQLLLSMLYIMAMFFDDMKLYTDTFSTLNHVDYDDFDSMPDNFLTDFSRRFGFNIPELFSDASIEQYVRAENVDWEISSAESPLRTVRNKIMRRLLINLPNVLKSKGTQHGIRAFLRSMGIDPDNTVKIREYGGPTKRQLSVSRECRRDIAAMVEFTTASFAATPYLSASRTEPGMPTIAGSFVDVLHNPPIGISNNLNDGLLTSGSWTVEFSVKYTPPQQAASETAQSFVRLCVDNHTASQCPGLLANIVAISSSVSPLLSLYVRPSTGSVAPMLHLSMSVNDNELFNGDIWHVSFGCVRNDEFNSIASSSYFLRYGNANNGDLWVTRSTSSYFDESPNGLINSFRSLNDYNMSGTFIAVGNNQTIPVNASYQYLNNSTIAESSARTTAFDGSMMGLRFWSRAISEIEWHEHVKNYKSLGTHEPSINFNFVHSMSGSFGKLRLNTFNKQETRAAISSASLGTLGTIMFIDHSQNNMHVTGSGFPIDKNCYRTEIIDYSHISPDFDDASSDDKVRIRSFSDQSMYAFDEWTNVAPVYELVKSEPPTDDTRFAVEFSLIDALNRDIIMMFATLDALDNAIGAPELMYSPDYPGLETLRDVYFTRLLEKLNFRAYFDFFRWIDGTIGIMIQQLIPKKTRFKGTNFVIESHMLERHKLEHIVSDSYLTERTRNRIKDVLLLQLISGDVKKY